MLNFGTIVADLLHMIKQNKIVIHKHADSNRDNGMIIAKNIIAMSGGNYGF